MSGSNTVIKSTSCGSQLPLCTGVTLFKVPEPQFPPHVKQGTKRMRTQWDNLFQELSAGQKFIQKLLCC